MSKWDIARPHRLLINQSLRKETEKLRVHIDEYQQKYDEQYEKNVFELEETREKLNADFEIAKAEILKVLSTDVETMQAISNAIADYVSAFFDRQLLFKKKEINTLQQAIINEYVDFLSEEMKEIGSEIDMLRVRRDTLSREAEVTDMLELIGLSGTPLDIENVRNAKELLDKIKEKMELSKDENEAEWYALLNARIILEERVSFIAEVQYISWVIEQKIQLSKELKNIRDEKYRIQSNLQADAIQIQGAIDSINTLLLEKAQEIRFYWAKPIVYIGAEIEDNLSRIKQLRDDITEYSDKRKQLYDEKNSVQQDIERMKEEHSSDSYRWDRLQRERRDLSDEIRSLKTMMDSSGSEIESLKGDIDCLKSKRKEWNLKRTSIQNLLWKYSVSLMRIGTDGKKDDEAFAEIRLRELVAIEEEGQKTAQQKYLSERESLIVQRDMVLDRKKSALSQIETRLATVKSELKTATEQLDEEQQIALEAAKSIADKIEKNLLEQQELLSASKKKLKNIQAADVRFVIVRLFSDTPEEKKAKSEIVSLEAKIKGIEAELKSAKKRIASGSFAEVPAVSQARKTVEGIQDRIRLIEDEFESVRKQYDEEVADISQKIETLRPHPERPTSEERTEMEKIHKWEKAQKKINGKRKGKH